MANEKPEAAAKGKAAAEARQAAACAWELVHHRRLSMAQAARKLGSSTHAVGEMLAAHRRVLEAQALARATKAGMASDTMVEDLAAARQLKIERARKLLADGLSFPVITERLGLHGSELAKLPEARQRNAAMLARVAEGRQTEPERVKAKRQPVSRPCNLNADVRESAERIEALRRQVVRDGWQP